MVSAQVHIKTLHGLHLRPAGALAEYAMKYHCKITLVHEDKNVNAKSLLGVLSLCIRQDMDLEIVCDGMDEDKALADMLTFIEAL